MPGDKKHHTDKFRRCVEKVIASGKAESNAYAICTATFQDSGDAIFENAEEHKPEMHVLHLLGATGDVRTEVIDGREHLVVPVVALMEGVIHAVNADTPEFVPWETIERMAASFNGKPVTLGHPVSNGRQCSASVPGIVDSHGIGKIRNSHAVKEGKKLLMETLLDKQRTAQLHPEMYQRLLAGEHEEVSVGAFVVTDEVAGNYSGKQYKATWLAGSGDHLAFLPGKRGACSIAMGCGAHRAAMLVTAEEFVPVPEYSPVLAFTTLDEKSLDDRMQAVQTAINSRWSNSTSAGIPGSYGYAVQTFDDRVIVRIDNETFSVDYTVEKDGTVKLGEPKRVKQAWVAAAKKGKYEDCPTCKGSGNVNGNPCEMCDGEGEIRAAALVALLGLRPCSDSAKDIYSQAMKALGAPEGHPFYGNQYTQGTGSSDGSQESIARHREQLEVKQANNKTWKVVDKRSGSTVLSGYSSKEVAEKTADEEAARRAKKEATKEHERAETVRSKVNENKPENVIKNVHRLFRLNEESIRFEGGHWVLFGSDNKLRLGQYKTKEEAEEHGKRIEQVLARA